MAFRSIPAIFFAFAASIGAAATGLQCGVNAQLPAKRVFAKVGYNDAWREYPSIENVPDLDLDGGISAQLWEGTDGSRFILTVAPGEDFWTYTEYCFAKSGKLGRVGFELRTAWGWAYRLEAQVESGAIHDASSQFFDTKTQKAIPKPEQADDVSDAMKPTLYLQVKQLPFSRLLAAPSKSGKPPHRNSASFARTGISP